MNKSYRTVWNATTGTWVAAEETARSKSKGSSRVARKAFVAVTLGGVAIGGAAAADFGDALESTDGSGDEESVIQVPITGTKSQISSRSIGTDAIGTMAALDDAYIKVNGSAAAMALGTGTVAIGSGARADGGSNGTGTIAIGNGANANGANASFSAIAIGNGASAVGNALALGASAVSANRAVAIGGDARANGTGATALGYQTRATATDAVAVGHLTSATGANSIAIGDGATKANGSGSVAIGSGAANTGTASLQLAIGGGATTQGTSSTAVGSSAAANGTGALAAGRLSNAAGNSATALGNQASAQAGGATALGNLASVAAGATNSVAIGSNASVAENVTNSMALGTNATATRNNTISVGSATLQRQITNLAAGTQATDAVNLGQMTTALATKLDNTYFKANSTGAAAAAGGMDSIAIGGGANARGANSIALGAGARVALTNSSVPVNGIAIGVNALVGDGDIRGASGSISIGDSASSGGFGSTSLGANASGTGSGATSIGSGAYSQRGVAVGSSAHADANGSTALGVNATSTASNGVALGNASLADRANSVSVGSSTLQRQITNLAAGTQATDAVNISQLTGVTTALGGGATIGADGSITQPTYSVGGTDYHNVGDALDAIAQTSGADAVNYDDASRGTVTLAGANGTTITNVKAGDLSAASTDAVNGSQLFATNTRVGSLEDSLKGGGVIDPDTGESLAVVYDGTAKDKVTLGGGANGTTIANVKAGVADMDAVNVSQLKGAGLIDPVTGQPIAAVTYDRNADGTPNYGSVTLGDGNGPVKVTNVADATGDSDALNLGQLKQAGLVGEDGQGNLTSLAVTYDDATKTGVTLGNTGTPVALHNVADGVLSETSKDAVNGSQLFATNTRVGSLEDSLQNGGVIDPTTGESLAVVYDGTAKDKVTLAGGATGTTITNVKAGELSATSTEAVNGSQLFATNQDLGDLRDSLQSGGVIDPTTGESLAVVYDGTAKDKVTLAGGATGTTIANVKAGVADMDAVNVSQLKDSGLIGNDGKAIAAVTYDRNADGTPNFGSVTLGGAGASTPVALKNVATGVDGTDAVNVDQMTDGLTKLKEEMSGADLRFVKVNADPATGTPALANGALAVAIGAGAAGSGAHALALGTGARASGLDSVAIGYNSVANEGNTVSVGRVGGERRIVNVADGNIASESTDAVNGGQLYAAMNNLSTSMDAKTQQAITDFSTSLDEKTQAAIDRVNSRSMDLMDVNAPLVAVEGLQGDNLASLNGADPNTMTAAAIGSSSVASGGNAVAVGLQNVAGSDNSVAIGSFAQTGAGQAYSVAVGSDAQTNGTQAVALGAHVQANGDHAVAVGNNNTWALGDSSVALGDGAKARVGATNSIAVGTSANVATNVANAIALGANANVAAGATGGIALGAGSLANRGNALSIGSAGAERQIINVAAGTQQTDAVNVSQLTGLTTALGGNAAVGADGNITQPTYTVGGTDYHNVGDALDALAQTGDANAVTYDDASRGTVTLGGGANGTTLTNVKAGVADLDAVNVSQMKDSGLIGNDGKAIAAVTYDRNPDGTANYGSVTLGNGNGPVKVSNVADATGDSDALNLGQLKQAGLVGEDGQGNLTSLAVAYDDASKDKVTLAGGATGTTITNVKAGELSATSTDAVNGSQLFATNQDLGDLRDSLQNGGVIDPTTGESLAVVYDGTAKDKVTLAGGATGTTIANVKAGVADLDAVNVSQLKDSGLIGNDGKAIAAVTYDRNPDGTANYGSVTLGNGNGPVKVTNVADATGDSDALNLGQLKQAGLVGEDDQGNLTSLAVAYDDASKGTVTLGGGAAGTTITNVKAGELSATSTDAVNGSQLFATNQDIGDLRDSLQSGGVIDPTTGESLAVVYDSTAKDKVTLAGGATGTTISNVKAGVADLDAVNVSQLKGSGLIDPVTGQSIAAVTYDRLADGTANYGSVTLGNGNGPVKVSNVAAATADTDAVNYGQMKDYVDGSIGVPGNPLAVAYDDTSKGSITLGGANGTTITNVAAGEVSATSTDAINGSQLHGVSQSVADSLGGGSTVGADGTVTNPTYSLADPADASQKHDYHNVGDALANLDGRVVDNTTNITVIKNQLSDSGLVDPVTGQSIAAVTYDRNADGTPNYNSATLRGTDGTTLANVKAGVADLDAVNVSQLKGSGLIDPVTGQSIAAVTYDRNPDGTANYGSVTLGNGNGPVKVSNVADATGDSDALNLGQLKQAGLVGEDGQGNLTSLAVAYDDASKDTVTLGGGAAGTTITNVKAGELSATSTDAVNGSQLYATNTRVGSLEDSLQSGGVIDPVTRESLAVVYDSAAKNQVTLGGANATTPVQLKNVAAGTDGTDAVNVAQLKEAGLVAPVDPTNPGAGLTSLAVTYGDASKSTVALGGANGTTLSNVAAGAVSATSTDAINGSQLHGVSQSVADSLGGGSTVGADGAVTNPTYSLADPADASQKHDYHNVGDALANLDGRVVDNTTNITVIKNQLADSGLVDPVTGQSIAAVTYDRNTDGTPNYGSVTLGNGNDPVKVSNVADGVDRHDAVNLGQLQDAGLVAPVDPTNPGTMTSLAVTYGKNTDGTANFDQVVLAGKGGTTISNVKAGAVSATSTEAINGAQLHGVAQSVADSLGGGSTVDPNGKVTSPTYVVNNQTFNNVGDAITNISNSLTDGSIGLVQQDATSRDITVAKDTDGTVVDFTGTAGDRVLTGVAAGAVNATSNDAINGSQLHGTAQSVADVIGGGTTVDPDGKLADTAIEVNGQKYSTVAEAVQAAAAYGATDSLAVRYDLNADGTPNFGSVTLGGSGAAPVILTNVADGVNKYDAVNFGQLSELSDRLDGVDDRVGALELNPGNGGGGGGGSGDNPYFSGTDVTAGSSTAANAGTGTGNTAAGSGASVGSGANNATVIGSSASASKDNGTAIGSGASSTGEGATAIGSNANASGSGSVAIGQGSVANEANTVSFGNGNPDGNRRIVNIADGINANDAATRGQLDREIAGVRGQINDVSKNAYSGIAAATALTMIPGVDPGKTLSFGVGGATYKGYQAVAFGGEARITQNLKMKAGVGLSSGGNTVGVGASYQW